MKYDDTIVAIATPPGQGAIGVVRISGANAHSILTTIVRPRRAGVWRARVLRYGHVCAADGTVIDEVLAVWMPAPHTYTGEDVVEISCHGGRVALELVLQRILACGARGADPGEFTMRAFVAGRIDLSQAEAVMDVVQAQTAQALSQAHAQLQGWLGRQVTQLRDAITYELAAVVARIDFPDEVDETAVNTAALHDVVRRIDDMLAGARAGMAMRDGATVALIGRPNVGKSSLLNSLLRHDRAIVSPIAGTTRDTLAEVADIHGIPIRFVDTAGIRDDSDDIIEQLGIARSRDAALHADLALWLVDATSPLTHTDTRALAARSDLPVILVRTKSDLPGDSTLSEAIQQLPEPSFVAELAISNVTHAGIETLTRAIADFFVAHTTSHDVRVNNSRHVDALRRCRAHLVDAVHALDTHVSADLIAVDLQVAVQCLGEITGTDVSESLLDTIFARFCIGK